MLFVMPTNHILSVILTIHMSVIPTIHIFSVMATNQILSVNLTADKMLTPPSCRGGSRGGDMVTCHYFPLELFITQSSLGMYPHFPIFSLPYLHNSLHPHFFPTSSLPTCRSQPPYDDHKSLPLFDKHLNILSLFVFLARLKLLNLLCLLIYYFLLHRRLIIFYYFHSPFLTLTVDV